MERLCRDYQNFVATLERALPFLLPLAPKSGSHGMSHERGSQHRTKKDFSQPHLESTWPPRTIDTHGSWSGDENAVVELATQANVEWFKRLVSG